MTTTIALGLATALDIDTVRELYDYGGLDDAGVASALEQTGLQRSGVAGWPGYLTRIRRVAVVVDSGADITLAAFEAETLEQERGVLEALFALLPDSADGRCVAWQSDAWALLIQRAYRHQLRAPAAVHGWTRQPLCRLFDDPVGGSDHDVQADAIRLYGSDEAALDGVDPALCAAVHWHAMDMRWRCVSGDVDGEVGRQLVARVLARVRQIEGTVS